MALFLFIISRTERLSPDRKSLRSSLLLINTFLGPECVRHRCSDGSAQTLPEELGVWAACLHGAVYCTLWSGWSGARGQGRRGSRDSFKHSFNKLLKKMSLTRFHEFLLNKSKAPLLPRSHVPGLEEFSCRLRDHLLPAVVGSRGGNNLRCGSFTGPKCRH